MISDQDEIMVVEDERESRDYLVQILQLEGFKVVAFGNGAEALNYLHQPACPCLIILDMRMPVMDGSEFRSSMLRDPRLAKIPVVVITAFEPPMAASLAALRVFRKPIDVGALLDTVREIC